MPLPSRSEEFTALPYAETIRLTYPGVRELFLVRGHPGIWVERVDGGEGRIRAKAHVPTLKPIWLERLPAVEAIAKRAFNDAVFVRDDDRIICDRCAEGALLVVERGDDVLCRQCADQG